LSKAPFHGLERVGGWIGAEREGGKEGRIGRGRATSKIKGGEECGASLGRGGGGRGGGREGGRKGDAQEGPGCFPQTCEFSQETKGGSEGLLETEGEVKKRQDEGKELVQGEGRGGRGRGRVKGGGTSLQFGTGGGIDPIFPGGPAEML